MEQARVINPPKAPISLLTTHMLNSVNVHSIRESVDSLCRDGADMPIVRVIDPLRLRHFFIATIAIRHVGVPTSAASSRYSSNIAALS